MAVQRQYDVRKLPVNFSEEIKFLNELGEKHWELVVVIATGFGKTAYLKRIKTE